MSHLLAAAHPEAAHQVVCRREAARPAWAWAWAVHQAAVHQAAVHQAAVHQAACHRREADRRVAAARRRVAAARRRVADRRREADRQAWVEADRQAWEGRLVVDRQAWVGRRVARRRAAGRQAARHHGEPAACHRQEVAHLADYNITWERSNDP